MDATLMTNNSQHCWMLHAASVCPHSVACCWMLLRVVARSLKPVKLFSQQLPTFLLFRDQRSVAQQCWIRFAQLFQHRRLITHGLQRLMGCILPKKHYRSQHMLGVVASVCRPLPTCTQQLPTLLAQQCWEFSALRGSYSHAIHIFLVSSIYIYITRESVLKQCPNTGNWVEQRGAVEFFRTTFHCRE